MVTDNMVVIKVKSTGNEYAYPESKYSEIPVVAVENGNPSHTNFSRSELVFMVSCGSAFVVGSAKLALDVKYD